MTSMTSMTYDMHFRNYQLDHRAPVPRAHAHHGTMPLCCYADVAGGIAVLAQGLEFRPTNAGKNGHITPLKTKMSPLKGTTFL